MNNTFKIRMFVLVAAISIIILLVYKSTLTTKNVTSNTYKASITLTNADLSHSNVNVVQATGEAGPAALKSTNSLLGAALSNSGSGVVDIPSAGFLEAVTNMQSGIYAVAEPGNVTVLLKDKAGNTLWSRNVKDIVNSSPAVFLGQMRVKNMRFGGGGLIVRIGKSDFLLNSENGDVLASNAY